MIPVNEPLFKEREMENVTECIRTGWVSSAGRFIDQFEELWASYCGRKHGVAVSNGTTALQVAVDALDLNPQDEVIMPSFTIISCAQAVVRAGGVPVLVDCDPETWTMDVTQVESRITSRTRAIMPVHIYGHPVEMIPLLTLAEKYGLAIIEDAAEAHGAEVINGNGNRSKCGSFGALSCFSFYANKLVTTGEGGMVLTDDFGLAAKIRSLRNLCFRPERRFYHEELGYNFRMTNLQAALGVAQVERIDEIVAIKRWMGQEYSQRLAGLPGLQLPVEKDWARNVYWMYGVVLDESTGYTADTFAHELAETGIQTRPFFLGMHEQPVFHRMGLFRDEHYPVTERIARQGLYLPSGVALTEGQLAQVVESVSRMLGEI